MSALPSGPVLAIDTSTDIGSVAVSMAGEVAAASALEERGQHSARLSPLIETTLAEAGVGMAELAALVVGSGPGSFTGVRVAAATAKGLSHALDIPLWPVSSLAGIAMAGDAGSTRYVLLDARGERVYGACYQVDAEGLGVSIEPHGGEIGDVLARRLPDGCVFVGDGALRHRDSLEAAGCAVGTYSLDRIAEGLVAAAHADPTVAPATDPRGWEPMYIRPFRPGAAAQR